MFFLKYNLRRVKESSLFTASGIYTLSSFLNASIPFLLLPFLTKYLSRSDFGIVFMFATFSGFIMPFVGFNMEGAIARRYYTENNDISKYIGNCIIVSIFSTAIVFILCFFLKKVLHVLTEIPFEWILLGVFYCFSQFIILILLTLFQVKIKPLNYGLLQISQSVLNFLISIILVIYLNLRWEGRLAAQLFTSLLFAVIGIKILLSNKQIIFKIDFVFIKHAVKFGGGLIPHALGGGLIMLTNRFFLTRMVNINEAGLYGVANQIGSIVAFFTVSFNNAFVPWLYAKLNQKNDLVKAKIVKLTYMYFLSILIFGIILYLTAPIIFKIFINHNFNASLKYCIWIIWGFVFQGMYFMVTNYIMYSEKTYYQAFVTLFVGILNIPANFILINQFGAIGAAMAFCISFFLLFICTWILSSRVYKMPWGLNILNLKLYK